MCVCVCVFRSSCRLSFKLARADLRQPDAEKSRSLTSEREEARELCNMQHRQTQLAIRNHAYSQANKQLSPFSSPLFLYTVRRHKGKLIAIFDISVSVCLIMLCTRRCLCVCVQHKSNKQRDYLHATPLPLSSPLFLQIRYMLRALSET